MSALLAWVLLSTFADEISLPEYRDGLGLAAAKVREGDLDSARLAARHLLRVRLPEGIRPDPSILQPLAEAASLEAAKALLPRLQALIDALEDVAGGGAAAAADPALLARIRAREALAERTVQAHQGPTLHAPRLPFLDRLRQLWDDFWAWVGRFLRALFELLFRTGPAGPGGSVQGWTLLALGVVVAALFTALLLRRRGAEAAAPVDSTSRPLAPSVRDEDPLSRSATEWERFAADLMRQGRFREAIRAWYHASLVSLFRTGQLQYRKDRTNWEYAFRLPPDFAGRSAFLEATRTFEREWYGRTQTPPETAASFESAARAFLDRLRGAAPA